MGNGPLSLGISHNLLMGLGISDFESVGHIFAFLSSHYTFSSRTRILRCQSWCLGESRIYYSPPLYVMYNLDLAKTENDI